MKTYKDKHNVEFEVKTKYLVRRITEDGLVKCFIRYGDEVGEYPFNTTEKAIEFIAKNELDGAVIIPKIVFCFLP